MKRKKVSEIDKKKGSFTATVSNTVGRLLVAWFYGISTLAELFNAKFKLFFSSNYIVSINNDDYQFIYYYMISNNHSYLMIIIWLYDYKFSNSNNLNTAKWFQIFSSINNHFQEDQTNC